MLKTVLWLSWPANTDLHQGFSCAGSAREKPVRMVIDSGRGHAPDKANHRSSPSALLRDCALPCLHCSAQPGIPVYDPAFVRHETFLAARPEYHVHKSTSYGRGAIESDS